MARRKTGRDLNGVLLFDKPYGLSSNNAMQKARRLFDANKAGHSGALDPIATGLLPICFGRYTRLNHYVLGQDKRYIATLRLGQTTTTGDTEGDVLVENNIDVDIKSIEAALTLFTGEQLQIPPMYSALKHKGKPLYEYARKGITIERKARAVTAYWVQLLEWENEQLIIDVKCSSGFYIRTLVEEIGTKLGCGAHLTALRRTQVGELDINDAIGLDELEERSSGRRDSLLINPLRLVGHLSKVDINSEQAQDLKNGLQIELCTEDMDELVVVAAGELVGIVKAKDGRLKPIRIFV